MKIRIGFVSNSSTASFVIKTRPTKWDLMMAKSKFEGHRDVLVLPSEKIKLLKKCGFVPTKISNPFQKELSCDIVEIGEPPEKDTEDDTLLGYWVSSNHREILEFLVAHDIPFKASVHYSHHLYSYDPRDGHIYILPNLGIEYFNDPREIEEEINGDGDCFHKDRWDNFKPFEKISKKEFLKYYDEKESLELMKR